MLEEKRPNTSLLLLNRVIEGALGAMTEVEECTQKEVDALSTMLGIAVRELGGSLEISFDAVTDMQRQGPKPAFHIDRLNRKTIITCK